MKDPQGLYIELGQLIATFPRLNARPIPPETYLWVGRAVALVKATGNSMDTAELQRQTDWALQGYTFKEEAIFGVLYRALAAAEFAAPAAARGAFISSGSPFDAFAAVGKVLATSTAETLIVDPYLDEKVLTDFLPQAAEGVSIRLLADAEWVKPSLAPAVARWKSQFPNTRRLEARLSPRRSLHDRLMIVDGKEAWVLTQSFNAFAARTPASIVKAGEDQAALKVGHYQAVWASALPI